MGDTLMALTAKQIVTEELAQLGLTPGEATAAKINSALKTHFGGAAIPPVMDPRTGLPYTQATAADAGSGNLAGKIFGSIALGYAGAFAAGLTGAGAAADEGADAGAGAAASESTAAGTAGGAATAGKDLATLLGVTGTAALVVRGLEAAAGAGLVALGLSAMSGGSGNPVSAAKSVARRVR